MIYDKPLPPPPEKPELNTRWITDEAVENYLRNPDTYHDRKILTGLLYRIAKALENNQTVKFL